MHFILTLISLLCLSSILGPAPAQAAVSEAYWVWAGDTLPELPRDTVVYLYQGNLNTSDKGTKYASKGLHPYPLKDQHLILVFRIYGPLPPPGTVLQTFKHRAARWKKHKAVIDGIQIDFDAATNKLTDYAAYMMELRQTLPAETRLSVTGLGDWVKSGTPADLENVSIATDEIVFRLYKGLRNLPDSADYPALFEHIGFPFKIGLIEGTEAAGLGAAFSQNAHFKGFVYSPGAATTGAD